MAEYANMKRVKSSSDTGILALAAVGGCAIGIFLAFYSVVVSGWVLTVLWSWFVSPTFHLPALSLPVAIGASAIVRLLTYVDTSDLQKRERTSDEKWAGLIGQLISPWSVLTLGWLVHLFV